MFERPILVATCWSLKVVVVGFKHDEELGDQGRGWVRREVGEAVELVGGDEVTVKGNRVLNDDVGGVVARSHDGGVCSRHGLFGGLQCLGLWGMRTRKGVREGCG